MSRLDALNETEQHRAHAVTKLCDRMAATLEEYRTGVEHDRTVTTVTLGRQFDKLREAEVLWNAAKLARLNAEAELRNETRERRNAS